MLDTLVASFNSHSSSSGVEAPQVGSESLISRAAFAFDRDRFDCLIDEYNGESPYVDKR